ncbi:MAG TPA: DUF433 domain-containing protein [Candidatus Brocadiia bacterium]|nr:DUF433 domain-containing protein [Planctomycetota bacterium]MBI4008391.1 DUF433 domain-containing protein [Planctomycetota bacterium]MDO8091861.1 DUF433 domain-containing protein [Candidatus Brocadiales bacterium]
MGITIDKKIMHGKPVVEGTRVPVNVILGSLAGGMTFQEICNEYGVTKDDIRNCLRYATELTGSEYVFPLKRLRPRKDGTKVLNR